MIQINRRKNLNIPTGNQNRYQMIFKNSPIAILLKDASVLRQFLPQEANWEKRILEKSC